MSHIVQKRARLNAANARELLAGASIVVDGSDSFTTRFDVNAACYDLGLPLVSGAVGRWSAQVCVFKAGLTKGKPQGIACPAIAASSPRCRRPKRPAPPSASSGRSPA